MSFFIFCLRDKHKVMKKKHCSKTTRQADKNTHFSAKEIAMEIHGNRYKANGNHFSIYIFGRRSETILYYCLFDTSIV